MESQIIGDAADVVQDAQRHRRTATDRFAEYPLIGTGIILGLAIAASGIYKWKKNPAIATSAWLQRYRIGSSAPVVVGALFSAMLETPEKRKARKERYQFR